MAIVASGQLTLVDLNDSKQLVSYIGSSQSKTVIHDPNINNYVPNYGSTNQVLTPQLFIAGTNTDVAGQAKSTKWFYQTNGVGALTEITASGGGYTLGTGAVKTLTITTNVLASNRSMVYVCEMIFTDTDTGFDVITKSEIELVKVTNGQKGEDGAVGKNAVTAFLTNEAVTIPANSAGTPSSYSNSDTQIHVYDGATQLQYDGTGTANGTFKVVATATGVTNGTITDGGAYAQSPLITGMGSDTGTISFAITGKTLTGEAISITKIQSFTKVRAGASGTTPTTYWLMADASALQKNASNVYSPTSINLTGKAQTGTASPVAYAGRFRISESTDGSTFTAKYTSGGNESTKNYVPSATNIKAIKVEFFLAGGVTNLLDEQVIPIVSDGAKGADGSDGENAVIATVWTPDGNTLKNHEGTLTATVDVYSGTAKVTPTAFKWYIQDPLSKANGTNGGDADGGDGWRLLNETYNAEVTGWNTDTITIPPSAIVSVESFKAVATYNGKKYTDVCTVIDVTDPIVVTVVGLNTFKNGQGETTLTARLYRNGAEIDNLGNQGYTYTWSIYNQNNVKTSFSKTGKTITVSADDIDVRGNVVCEVSK